MRRFPSTRSCRDPPPTWSIISAPIGRGAFEGALPSSVLGRSRMALARRKASFGKIKIGDGRMRRRGRLRSGLSTSSCVHTEPSPSYQRLRRGRSLWVGAFESVCTRVGDGPDCLSRPLHLTPPQPIWPPMKPVQPEMSWSLLHFRLCSSQRARCRDKSPCTDL